MVGDGRTLDDLLAGIEHWGVRLARVVADVGRHDFAQDDIRQLAAAKCIEAIGEACGRLLEGHAEFARGTPQLQFVEAYRMRNRLSHGYDSIDWQILWDTATRDVPALVAGIRALRE